MHSNKLLLTLYTLIFVFCQQLSWAQCDATFTTSHNPCDQTVTFYPSNPSSNYTYSWDFGDGTMSSDDTITHTFPTQYGADSNQYSVILTIIDASIPCTASTTINLMIYELPHVHVGHIDPSISLNLGYVNCSASQSNPNYTLYLEDSSSTQATNTQYHVDWGHPINNPSTNTYISLVSNPSHLYTSLGLFDITITVTGANGCQNSEVYDFFNGSNPSVGLSILGDNVFCNPGSSVFPIDSVVNNNPPGTTYTISVNDASADTIFVHPPPTEYTHDFISTSCGTNSTSYQNAYQVQIVAKNKCFSSTATVEPIRVYEGPKADFTISPDDTNCINTIFTFTDSSDAGIYWHQASNGCITNYTRSWSIFPNTGYSIINGDTATSSLDVSFSQAGVYTIRLIVQNPTSITTACAPDTIEKQICVVPDPLASFTLSDTTGCFPITIQTTNTSNTLTSCEASDYIWSVTFEESDCGEGASYLFVNNTNQNSINPEIRFDSSGIYIIQLMDINRCDTSIYVDTISIARAPNVTLNTISDTCIEATILPNIEFQNDCYSSTSFMWYFPGSVNVDSIAGEVPGSIDYKIGTFDVILQMSNTCGNNRDTVSFTVYDQPTLPNISSNSPLCQEDTLNLEASVVPDVIYFWYFNNALISNTRTYSKEITVTDAGTYMLIVEDTITGCRDTTDTNVAITNLPGFSISPTNPSICIGETQTLTAIGAATNYTWANNLDNTILTGSNITITPNSTIIYTVSGTDGLGCTNDTVTSIVTVNDLPVVSVSTQADSVICQDANTVLLGFPFTSNTGIYTPLGTPSKYWSGDDVDSSGNFLPTANGNDTLTYHYIDENGCRDSSDLEICVVENNVNSNFTLSSNTGCRPFMVSPVNTSNTLNGCSDAVYTWSVTYDTNSDCSESGAYSFTGTLNDLQPTFTFDSAGVYTLALKVVNECDSSTFTQTITVKEEPEVTIANIIDYCGTASFTPTATIENCYGTITSYDWIFNGGSPSTFSGQNAPMVGYNISGNVYGVTLEVENECGITIDTVSFEIFDLPDISATNSSPVCVGDDIVFTANSTINNLTYQWSNLLGSDASETLLNVQLSDAITYSITVTDANNCSNSDTTLPVINSLSTPTVTVQPQRICDGDTATLIATGGVNYSWQGISENNDTVYVTPSVFTNYPVTVTDNNGCQDTTSTYIFVDTLPNVEAGPDISLCNQNIPFTITTATPPGGFWYGSSIIDGAGVVTPNGVTVDTVCYEYTEVNTGCTNTDCLIINISEPDTISLQDDIIVCEGTSIIPLIASPTTGNWSGSSFLIGNTFNPAAAGTYELVYSIAVGTTCEQHDTLTITVLPLPNIQSTPSTDTTCEGESTILTASGGVSYSWSPNIFLDIDTGNTVIATPAAGIQSTLYTYIVVGTDAQGCIDFDTSTILVHPLPNAIAHPDETICNQPIPVQLSGNHNNSGIWSGNTNMIDVNGLFTPTGNPDSIGVYTVYYTYTESATGCSDIDSTLITIDTPAVLVLPADMSVCLNSGTISLNALPTSGEWIDSVNNLVTPNGDFTPTIVGTHILYFSDGEDNCFVQDSMVIIVHPLPSINANSPLDTICSGDTVTITATGGVSYSWSPSNTLDIDTGNIVQAFPTTSINPITINYIVIGLDNNSCESRDTSIIVVNPIPDVTVDDDIRIICNQLIPVQLNATPIGGLWSSNTSMIDSNGVVSPTGDTIDNGTYNVVYTYIDPITSCYDTASMLVIIESPANIIIPNDTSVCINSSSFELSALPTGGVWSNVDNLISNDSVFTPSLVGTHELVYTYGVDNCLRRDTMIVTVNPLPNIIITPQLDTICTGDTAIFTVTGGVSYKWTPLSTLNTDTGNVVMAFPTTSNNNSAIYKYYVTGTDSNSCINIDSTSLLVHPLPYMFAGDPISFCHNPNPMDIDLPSVLFPDPATGGIWTGAGIVDSTQGTFRTDTAGGLGYNSADTVYTITYYFIDGNGCYNDDTVDITVTAPDTAIAPDLDTVCQVVDTFYLTNYTPVGGFWILDDTITLNDSIIHPMLLDTGLHQIIYVLGDETCRTYDTTEVYIAPTPVVMTRTDTAICLNQPPIQLYGFPDTSSYWVGPNVDSSGLFTPDSAGLHLLYYYYVHPFTGCVGYDSMQIMVDTLPYVFAGDPISFCHNPNPMDIDLPSVLFPDPATGGIWTGAGIVDSTQGTFRTDTAGGLGYNSADTVYTITYYYINNNGCYNDDTVDITVTAPDTAIAPDLDTVCQVVDTFYLTNYTPVGGFWILDDTITLNDSIIHPMLLDTGLHQIIYVLGDETCRTYDTTEVYIAPTPVLMTRTDTAICLNQPPIQLYGFPDTSSYWVGPNVDSSGLFTPDSAGFHLLYYYYVHPFTGCVGYDSMQIMVDTLPYVFAGDPISFCHNPNPMDIDLPSVLFPDPATGGIWTGAGIVDSTQGTFRTDTAGGLGYNSADTVYTITYYYINNNGCYNDDTVDITVTAPDTAIAPDLDTVCQVVDTFYLTNYTPVGGFWILDDTITLNDSIIHPMLLDTGLHQIIYVLGDETCRTYDTTEVYIAPTPVLMTRTDTAICLNQPPIQLYGFPDTSSYWVGPNVDSSGLFTPDSAGLHLLYYYYVHPFTGCVGYDSMQIMVDTLPYVFAGDPISFCHNPNPMDIDLPSVLFPDPATGGIWTGAGIVDSTQGTFRTDTAGGLGYNSADTVYTITYYFIDGNGCYNDDTVDITVTAPDTAIAPDLDTVCQVVDTFYLTNYTPVGGFWILDDTITLNDSIIHPMLLDTGLHQIIYVLGDETCRTYDTTEVYIAPTPVVMTRTDTAVCLNQPPIQLYGFPDTSSYWVGPNVDSSGLFTPDSAGLHLLYYYYVHPFTGCVGYDSMQIMVDTLPYVFAGDPISFCHNPNPMDIDLPSVLFPDPATGGIWTGAGIVDSTQGTFRTDTAGGLGYNSADTVYTITYYYINNNGCYNDDTVDITVTAPDTAIAPDLDTVCQVVDTFYLTNYTPVGGFWILDDTITLNDSIIHPMLLDTGLHQIIYVLGDETCRTYDTTEVYIAPTPVLMTRTDTAICLKPTTDTTLWFSRYE